MILTKNINKQKPLSSFFEKTQADKIVTTIKKTQLVMSITLAQSNNMNRKTSWPYKRGKCLFSALKGGLISG